MQLIYLCTPGGDNLFTIAPLGRNRDPAISTWFRWGDTYSKIQAAVLTNRPHLTEEQRKKTKQMV